MRLIEWMGAGVHEIAAPTSESTKKSSKITLKLVEIVKNYPTFLESLRFYIIVIDKN